MTFRILWLVDGQTKQTGRAGTLKNEKVEVLSQIRTFQKSGTGQKVCVSFLTGPEADDTDWFPLLVLFSVSEQTISRQHCSYSGLVEHRYASHRTSQNPNPQSRNIMK